MAGGAVLAAVALPALLPGTLAASLTSAEPKAYWYLSRASAFVAFILVWASMIFGLLMTSRTARVWPGGPAAFDLHQFTSLLGLGVALFHVLVLLGDKYIGYTLPQLLLPFNSTEYKPLWVGIRADRVLHRDSGQLHVLPSQADHTARLALDSLSQLSAICDGARA